MEIIAEHSNIKAVYRFDGRVVYLRCLNQQYATQLINQIESKGGKVWMGRNWIKCDIFGKNAIAKLGTIEIDLENEKESDIESKTCAFFLMTLKNQGFKVEVTKK